MANFKKWTNVSRRDFFKTTALAGMAATFPATSFAAQNSEHAVCGVKPSPAGKKRTLLFVTTAPERYDKLIGSIKSIEEYEILVTPLKTDFKNPAVKPFGHIDKRTWRSGASIRRKRMKIGTV